MSQFHIQCSLKENSTFYHQMTFEGKWTLMGWSWRPKLLVRNGRTWEYLQVPVDYVERVQVCHSLQHLSDDVGGISLCVVALVLNPVKDISPRGAVAKTQCAIMSRNPSCSCQPHVVMPEIAFNAIRSLCLVVRQSASRGPKIPLWAIKILLIFRRNINDRWGSCVLPKAGWMPIKPESATAITPFVRRNSPNPTNPSAVIAWQEVANTLGWLHIDPRKVKHRLRGYEYSVEC